MTKTIIGVFTEQEKAKDAIAELESKQYDPKDISIVMKDRDKEKELGQKTGADVGGGAMSGATAGGVIGALAGLLVSAGVIPGLGVLFIGGPLAAALGITGAAATTISGAATGVLAGGIVGALAGLGIAGEDATEYEESIKQGGILIAVPVGAGDEDEVRGILEAYEADKVRSIDATEPKRHSSYFDEESARNYAIGAKGGRSRKKS